MADDPYDPTLNPEPFDLSAMLPQHAAPQAAPQAQPGKKKGHFANIALAALMPLAAKQGGQVAVSGLLRGMQRAQAEGQQQAQQDFRTSGWRPGISARSISSRRTRCIASKPSSNMRAIRPRRS